MVVKVCGLQTLFSLRVTRLWWIERIYYKSSDRSAQHNVPLGDGCSRCLDAFDVRLKRENTVATDRGRLVYTDSHFNFCAGILTRHYKIERYVVHSHPLFELWRKNDISRIQNFTQTGERITRTISTRFCPLIILPKITERELSSNQSGHRLVLLTVTCVKLKYQF